MVPTADCAPMDVDPDKLKGDTGEAQFMKGSLEDALYSDPSKLTEPIKDVKDKWKLLPAFLKVRGLVKQQIDSFNYLVNHDMRNIIMAKGNQKILSEVDPDWYMKYLDIRVERPCTQEQYVNRRVTPHECRLRDMTYSAPIKVDIEYTLGRQIRVKRDVMIGRMPIMLRSDRCWLKASDEAELARQGECPLDPGGYFVVRGTEKVILIQEQLMRNRILIDSDSDGDVFAQVTSSDAERKTLTKIKHKKGKFLLQHNCFQDRDGINLVAVFKAMGVESDQEICQLVGGNEQLAMLLLPTINDCKALKVFTRKQALAYMVRRSKRAKYAEFEQRKVVKEPEDEAMEMLSNLILSHVPCEQFNLRNKIAYAAVMLRRMMYAILDPSFLDDRDYYGNKRLDLAGGQLSLLFEDLLKRLNTHLQLEAKKSLSKTNRAAPFDVVSLIRSDIITQAMETAISTGCWSIKRFRMERKGASQVLSRLSFIGAIGMMTRIMSQFEKTRKVSGPRALQPSQWGMICPCDTPEGESCGLVKNLALMTHVTTDEDEGPIARFAFVLGVQPISTVHPQDLFAEHSAVVHLNGTILGVHQRPVWFVNQFRAARRAGLITDFVSITLQTDSVLIACDAGRLCRPLIVCERGRPRIKQWHIDALKAGKLAFMDLVHRGILEFLDVNEENNSFIAMFEEDCHPEITHLEIEPFTIMGVVSGLIPFPHHNQSPRNTYQCAMGKQAMGNMAYNQHKRMDTLLYLLVYPMRPLLTTRTIELVGFDKLGAGQNASVCVMSYSGYDIEDAIVMNRASLDRGFGRCIVNHTYKAQLKRYGNRTLDRIVAPPRERRVGKYQILDDDGLAQVGEVIHPGDTYVFKQVPSNTRDPVNLNTLRDDFYRSHEQRYKGMVGENTVVDKVLLSGNDDTFMVIKTLVRHVRRPELGDKFSSRHGQKGVVGHIVPQEDMPFSEKGIVPDLIMNPHGFPSRMTVGKLIELLGSKAGLLSGRFHYGTAFGEPSGLADKVEDIMETLVRFGYSYTGKDLVTSGITGEALEGYIFMGPIYYQKLKHMVLDKVHARAKGPRVTLTRQPTEGRSRDGGLRLGEMERDCLVAYGASNLLLERLVISSDAFTAHVDTQSGLLGWWDGERQCAVSPVDKSSENMIAVQIPYACKLLFQELQAMNIVPRISLNVS